MAKIYGTPIGGGGTGTNTTLPPLLDNFKAKAKGNISKKGHGEAVNIIDSIESELNGLKLYGKSTQDGTPTPEAPVPIVSAGDSGTITVTVSDGAEQSQTLPISTPNGLSGIPVDSGGNYTDADGQQWVCDEIDFARGKYVQRFKMLEFDGTEVWYSTVTNTTEIYRWYLKPDNIKTPSSPNIAIAMYSTHYPAKAASSTWLREQGVSVDNNSSLIFYDDSHNTTAGDWKSYLAAQKAAGTPVKVVYELETPVETDIPEETIEAYKSLTTYASVTNIMTDSTPSAGIEIEYASTTMNVELSADKISENRAQNLLGAVWVYGDHVPQSLSDGTKIEFARDDVIQTGLKLSSLASGSKVKLGTYNGKPVKWVVARDSVTQDLRLVLEKDSVTEIGDMVYDAPEPSNTDSERKSRGNDRYIHSNIHQWINSTKGAGNWYTAQHTYDAPPDYQNKAGFLNEWSQEDLGVLQTISWKSAKNPADGGGTDEFTSPIVLISCSEAGVGTDNLNNKLDVFTFGTYEYAEGGYLTRNAGDASSAGVETFQSSGGYGGGFADYAQFIMLICAPRPDAIISYEDEDGFYVVGNVETVLRTVSFDSTKNFFSRQFTYNERKQYQTTLEGAIAELYLAASKPGDIETGYTISAGTLDGNKLKWRLEKSASGKKFLLLDPESAITFPFSLADTTDISKTIFYQWLNSDQESGWYTPIGSTDSGSSYYSYTQKPGFLSLFSASERAAFKDKEWKYYVIASSGTGSVEEKTINGMAMPIGGYEVGSPFITGMETDVITPSADYNETYAVRDFDTGTPNSYYGIGAWTDTGVENALAFDLAAINEAKKIIVIELEDDVLISDNVDESGNHAIVQKPSIPDTGLRKVFEYSSTPPSNTNVLWIDSVTKVLYAYNGSEWEPMTGVYGGTAQ